ncbi:hypothetical protein AB835_11885 [Candidatus Endobugula sertula]|uniref:Uncharacterized protein n=1 Tax=Candidatus Endobugula sertula TaxID=62101 RepID=A0A1D2QMP7_9GAMM|nr:hypothetical protein AB835_11885 [Candidatus Endobugula sertula]
MTSAKQLAKTTPLILYQKGVLDLSEDPIKHTLVCVCEWFDQEYKIVYKLIDLQNLHSYQ